LHAPFLLAQLSKAEARKSRISLYKQREAREGRIAKISSCEARKSRITERNKMSTYEELEKAEQEADAALAAMNADEPAIEAKPEDDKPVKPDVVDEGVVSDGVLVADDPAIKATPAEAPVKKDDDGIDYKQKFLVVDGMLKADTARLKAEAAQWREYATGLQERISVLEDTVKAKSSAVETQPDEEDYEVDAFVADNPGAAKLLKKMEAKHKAELASLRDEIKSVDQKSVATSAEFKQTTAISQFDRAMADAGALDWRAIDTDPGFTEWLNRSPYNVKVLQAAASEFDAPTVSAFFLDYKRSLETNGGDPPTDNGNGSQSKIEKFTAPPRSGGGGPPPKTAVSPVLTKENYAKFSKQAMTPGAYNPAQWGGKTVAQMDAIFDAAIAGNELR